MGNRQENIDKAVTLLYSCKEIRKDTIKVSKTIETSPWGFISDNLFLNCGMMFETQNDNIHPEEILKKLNAIERFINGNYAHRNAKGEYTDRLLDIDIIGIDQIVYESQKLIIPHQRMHLRDFVLIPMLELNPVWVHPILKRTISELLDEIQTE